MEYKVLGDYINLVDLRNRELGITNLLGVSIEKRFIPSIANIVGTDLSSYKVVKNGQFAYGPVTSRNGEKISIALLNGEDCIISSSYTVFEVTRKDELDPEYLMLWFSRPEFDRYARYRSHGSVREIFGWDEMCAVELPVPNIEKQRKIVKAYKTITDRIVLKQRINDNLETILATRFSQMRNNAGSRDTICLEKLINFGNGKARPSSVGNIPVYGGNGVLSYTDCYNAENVVLIGRVGAYCGSVYIEEQQCWVSDNAIVAKSKITNDEFFDYFLLKGFNLYDHHVGTGQQLLTQGILNSLECPSYNKEEMESFNKEAKPLFSIININNREIRMLNKTASMLLSRLSY
ncbi:restriction endonuclease subunit S [uncultured Ruminococcus sp.]|uniref:restriction endonuclease subunit S n=1 Tax=uncultured Ruminococcus sp. TaxID=165186 RepID=UPI0025E8BD77|nr:restriction endonuclease subunit S [uncultured Ruminococcus sp.]